MHPQACKHQFYPPPQVCSLDQYYQLSQPTVPTGQEIPKHKFVNISYYNQPKQQQYNQTSAPFAYQNPTLNNYSIEEVFFK